MTLTPCESITFDGQLHGMETRLSKLGIPLVMEFDGQLHGMETRLSKLGIPLVMEFDGQLHGMETPPIEGGDETMMPI